MARLVRSLCWRFYTLRMRLVGLRARITGRLRNDQIVAAHRTFSSNGGRGDNDQLNRAFELLDLVDTVQPRNIVEFGSGLTTAVLALYARRTTARHVSYEEDPRWADITRHSLKALGLAVDPICMASAVSMSQGNRAYDVEPTTEADFVYVDGPSSKQTPGFKGVCLDMIRLWDQGARPRAIVIDGRFPTVDQMRAHPAAASYDVLPETHYLMVADPRSASGPYRRHTVFLRKQQ